MYYDAAPRGLLLCCPYGAYGKAFIIVYYFLNGLIKNAFNVLLCCPYGAIIMLPLRGLWEGIYKLIIISPTG